MKKSESVFASLATSLLLTSVATAQTTNEAPLPVPLINNECVIGENPNWGWDGQQSCNPTNIWLEGAQYPLSRTSADHNGDNLAWDRRDFLNKTIRCEVYNRNYRPESNYEVDVYDTTFLDPQNPVIDPTIAQLPDATAHTYNSGWRIAGSGTLKGVLLSLNATEFSTESGYIFIYDTRKINNDKSVATRFSHCYLRDESAPLRASKYCVDYDGDGIGWNGTESCTVLTADPNCDYSQADQSYSQGWGYNPVTGNSCPPLPGDSYKPEDKCASVSIDGWGWNYFRQESCRVE